MDSLAVASPEVYTSAEELAEDIEFQKVLLLSLDDTPPEDRDFAETAIKAEIHRLEKELKALRQEKHNPMVTASGAMSYSCDADPFQPVTTNSTHGEQPGNPFPVLKLLTWLCPTSPCCNTVII